MAADIDTVIDVFSAQRLLVLGEDGVEIAHDALLQAWKQLPQGLSRRWPASTGLCTARS